jgi:predicted nucleotidyltransferase
MYGRLDVRGRLHRELQSRPWVLAAWEGGSAAFGRADEFSDLDLQVLVDDGSTEAALDLVEDVLVTLGGISHRHRLAEPTSHGHTQVFYRLEEGAPYFLLDLVVLERSRPGRLLERERHGEPIVLFDRTGEVHAVPIDAVEHEQVLAARLRRLRETVPLFADFPDKELRRGNVAGAVAMYHAFLLRPLTELLLMLHCPERFDFGLRYVAFDLPKDDAARLERLWLAGDGDAVAAGAEVARAWIAETLDALAAAGR